MQLNAATRRRAGFLFFRTLIYKDICVMILGRVKNYVSVAQGTEHRSPKAGVGGSNPLRDTMKKDRPRVCLFSCRRGGVRTSEGGAYTGVFFPSRHSKVCHHHADSIPAPYHFERFLCRIRFNIRVYRRSAIMLKYFLSHSSNSSSPSIE